MPRFWRERPPSAAFVERREHPPRHYAVPGTRTARRVWWRLKCPGTHGPCLEGPSPKPRGGNGAGGRPHPEHACLATAGQPRYQSLPWPGRWPVATWRATRKRRTCGWSKNATTSSRSRSVPARLRTMWRMSPQDRPRPARARPMLTVDVNRAWDGNTARRYSPPLVALGVTLIEQPVALERGGAAQPSPPRWTAHSSWPTKPCARRKTRSCWPALLASHVSLKVAAWRYGAHPQDCCGG